MNANGEARKRGGGMTRTFSPLTPIIQRLYSKSDEVRDTVHVCSLCAIQYSYVRTVSYLFGSGHAPGRGFGAH